MIIYIDDRVVTLGWCSSSQKIGGDYVTLYVEWGTYGCDHMALSKGLRSHSLDHVENRVITLG